MVYTPRQHVAVFSYKLSKLCLHPAKNHNLKEVYAFEFSEQVQYRRKHGTLPRAKFLSVNQRLLQQKNGQRTPRDQIFKKQNRAQEVSTKVSLSKLFLSALGTKCSKIDFPWISNTHHYNLTFGNSNPL